MMALRTWTKDPQAVLTYGIDWVAWLDGDSIATSTWALDDGLTEDSSSNTTTTTTITISGGTADVDYKAVNTVTTAGGLTDERTLLFRVRNR